MLRIIGDNMDEARTSFPGCPYDKTEENIKQLEKAIKILIWKVNR